MDGWMDGWMAGWVDGWMDGYDMSLFQNIAYMLWLKLSNVRCRQVQIKTSAVKGM